MRKTTSLALRKWKHYSRKSLWCRQRCSLVVGFIMYKINLYLECLFQKAQSSGSWLFSSSCGWPVAWIWAWCMEGSLYSFTPNVGYPQGRCTLSTWSSVSTCWSHCFSTKHHLSYRQVPTFGRDTIRCFRRNTSELKQMATRDFEDLLQVKFIGASNAQH